MHEYLDDEISAEHEKSLREHLKKCPECQTYFHELKKAIALVQSTSHIQAPTDFTAQVMVNLPKEKKQASVQRWFRNHPLLTAASLFLILMTGSLLSTWNDEYQFSVSSQPNLQVEDHTVIVPAGEVVKGDVIVKNGKLKIEGEIQGNATVINGEQYLASAGHVTGEIEEVNKVYEWIWYRVKKAGKDAINIFAEEEEPLE